MPQERPSREEFLPRMAKAYYDFLKAIAPLMSGNKDIEAGLKEGLRKFLSNVHISIVKDKHITDYYSEKAYDQLSIGNDDNLIYEHTVPKRRYQSEIVNAFMSDRPMSEDEIRGKLERCWFLASITKDEDKKLPSNMPKGWKEGDDPLARYREAHIVVKTWDEWSKIKSRGK